MESAKQHICHTLIYATSLSIAILYGYLSRFSDGMLHLVPYSFLCIILIDWANRVTKSVFQGESVK